MKQRKPFQFKNFIIHQENVTLPVTTDACIFGSVVAKEIVNSKYTNTILDLGTGTGVLMFFLNQVLPNAEITGIEKDISSFETALKNIIENKKNNLRAVNADFFEWQKKNLKKFDIIVSNPPFFENQLESEDPQKRQARHFTNNGFSEFFLLIRKLLNTNGNAWILLPFLSFNASNFSEEITKNFQYWSAFSNKNQLHLNKFITIKATESKKPHIVIIHLTYKNLEIQHLMENSPIINHHHKPPFINTTTKNINSFPQFHDSIKPIFKADLIPTIQSQPQKKHFEQIIVYLKNREYTKECFELLNPFYNFGIFGS